MKHLLTFILCSSVLLVKAQTELVENQSSAYFVGSQFGSNNGTTIVGITPGYIHNGRLGLGVTIGFESNNALDLNSTAVRPFLSYAALRQGVDDMPVNVLLSGAYQYNTFSDLDLVGNTVAFGIGVNHQIDASKTVALYPQGTVGWSRTTYNLSGFVEDASFVSYSLAMSVLFSRFYVTPTLLFSDGESNFRLSLGILFPQ